MKTLLLVDDEPGILEVLSDFLSSNFQILTAKNGQDAISKFNTNAIDLILSDIDMPIMNGLDLLKFIRKKNQIIPIIIMTGGLKNTECDILKLGANIYISKSDFNIETIEKYINELLK